MDYFESSTSYTTLTQRLNKVHEEYSSKYRRISYGFIAIWIVIGIIVAQYLIITDVMHMLPIDLLIVIGFILGTVYISQNALKSKIVNNYLNDEVVALYKMTEGDDLTYQAKPDFYKDFNKEMAIFVRSASPSCKYMISTSNSKKLNYKIMRISLTTSNGKTTTTHFDGHYITLDLRTNQHFHIKHKKQRQNRKHLKFYKVPNEEFYVYLSEEDYSKEEKRVIRNLDRSFTNVYQYAKEVFKTDKISIGSNKEQLHIAIGMIKNFKMPKEFNYENVKEYYDQFTEIIEGTNQIVDYINDQNYTY